MTPLAVADGITVHLSEAVARTLAGGVIGLIIAGFFLGVLLVTRKWDS